MEKSWNVMEFGFENCVGTLNTTKYGVDIVNQIARKYMVRNFTGKWIGSITHCGYKCMNHLQMVTKNIIPRRVFLQQLA